MDTQDFFLMVLGLIFAVIALTGLITFVHFRADVAKTKRDAEHVRDQEVDAMVRAGHRRMDERDAAVAYANRRYWAQRQLARQLDHHTPPVPPIIYRIRARRHDS